MRNITKRSVAMLLLTVMLFSCCSGILPVAYASEVENNISTTDPSEYVEASSESTEPVSSEASEPESGGQDNAQGSEVSNQEEASEPSESTTPTESESEVVEETTSEVPIEEVEPEVVYVKMEAESSANIFNYSKEPISNSKASNGYFIGEMLLSDVFSLELYDDLATSSLKYTPYVKYNISAPTVGVHTLHIGVELKNLKNVKGFYIPIVVNDRAYQATCEVFEGEDGFYEFEVEVPLVAGKNEVKCIAFDADLYLELINYNVSATSNAKVNFDYLGIPECISPLEKDKEEAVVEEVVETTEPAEETLPDVMPEESTENSEVTEPSTEVTEPSTEPSVEVTEPSEEVTEPTDAVEPTEEAESGGDLEDGLLVPSDVVNPDGSAIVPTGSNNIETMLNFVAIAESQIGNSESVYSEWWGSDDGSRSAMFISYCLYNAGISGLSFDSDWGIWIDILEECSQDGIVYYKDLSGSSIRQGDIVIYDMNSDGVPDDGRIVAKDNVGYLDFIGIKDGKVVKETTFVEQYAVGVIPVRDACTIPGSSLYGDSSSSGTGNAGGGNVVKPTPGGGSTTTRDTLFWIAPGVTVDVVLMPYGETYNRHLSYDALTNVVKNYSATIAGTSRTTTVYSGTVISSNTFIGDTATGRIFKAANLNPDTKIGYFTNPFNRSSISSVTNYNINPMFDECVSGPADVIIGNTHMPNGQWANVTLTMPKMNTVERFFQEIIFGERYGGWDETSVGKTSTGAVALNASQDVSQYKAVLQYLGCPSEYIENYVKGYSDQLNPDDPNDQKVLIPTIIWAYVTAESTAYNPTGEGTGGGMTYWKKGTDPEWDEDRWIYYKDTDLNATCCNDGSFHHLSDTKRYGHFSSVTPYPVHSIGNLKLNYRVYTVGDLVKASITANQPYGSKDSTEASRRFNEWWRSGYPVGLGAGSATTLAYESYVADGGISANGCGWDHYSSGACYFMFGSGHANGKHSVTANSQYLNFFAWHSSGGGFVNGINAQGVDNNDGNKWYHRGYWTPYGEKRTGSLSVKKASSTGSTTSADLQNWRFEVYQTKAKANAGNASDVIAYAYSNVSGEARFNNLAAGTYYIREAPASRQDKHTLSGWKLSATVLEGRVEVGSVISTGTIVNEHNPGKPLKVIKAASSTDCWNQIKNNAMYSLAGAQFQIIEDGRVVETVTTGADGTVVSSRVYMTGKTITIKEIVAPKGFLLNSTPKNVTIKDDGSEYASVTMYNVPTFDPALIVTKVDSSTKSPQGNTSFKGAVFKMEYYDNTSWSGRPLRIWYFETNTLGVFNYNSAYLAQGYTSSELYLDSYGYANIPLGSIKITEVSSPYGYLSVPVLYASITQSTNGAVADLHWTEESKAVLKSMSNGSYELTEPNDITSMGMFSIRKNDIYGLKNAQGDVPNLKAKFQIINRSTNPVKIGSFAIADPGEVCYEFWTNEAGDFVSDRIFPVGTYEIREVQAPEGMTLNSNWSQTFSITKDAKEYSFTEKGTACANTPYRGTISVTKFDIDDISTNEQGEASLEGAVFKIINMSKHGIFADRDGNGQYARYNPGQVCLYITTDANGVATSAVNALPYGTYRIEEVTPPTGYNLNDTWSRDFTIRTDGQIVEFNVLTDDQSEANGAVPEDVIRGGVKIVKYDALLGTATTENANLDGITYSIYSENDNYVYIDGVKYNKGDVVATMALVWDASDRKWVAQLDGDTLPYGTYTVRENPKEVNSGYANDYYFLSNENDVVEEYKFSIRNDGEIVTTDIANNAMEFHNMPIGRIEVLKVDVRNKKLKGVKFSLEWSTDGVNWSPVQSIPYGSLVQGGSTTEGIVTGHLVTDANGILAYEGLDPRLQYRLVEVETLNGYMLLKDPVYVGQLGRDSSAEVNYQVRVVNQDIMVLPSTGSMDMINLSVCLAICVSICFGSLVYFRKKEEV